MVSASTTVSSSHHGEFEVASPSDGVWYDDDDLDGGVPVQSDAVTKSSASDRLLLQLFSSIFVAAVTDDTAPLSFDLFRFTYHSWGHDKNVPRSHQFHKNEC